MRRCCPTKAKGRRAPVGIFLAMIPKPLTSILPVDVDNLLADEVPEGRTIDYKLELPDGSDSGKKEFLADVSSFANTVGGDIVFGVEENGGLPTAIRGLTVSDIDAEVQRLDSILLSGLDPRITYAMRHLKHPSGGVLIIRVEHSWIGPHRVTFKGHDRFYARNSAGKYSLDVVELRQAFLRNATAAERIRGFREERLLEIAAGRTPIPLVSPGRLVLHLIPLESFTSAKQVNVRAYYEKPNLLPPMNNYGWDSRITVSGMMTYTPGSPSHTYTQLHRNGIIEAVEARLLNHEVSGQRIIPTAALEKALLQATPNYLKVQKDLGIAPPIYVLVSLVGVKGSPLGVSNSFYDVSDRHAIDQDVLQLPEAVVQDYGDRVESVLRGPIDVFWNAGGYPKSHNFDDAGNWTPR